MQGFDKLMYRIELLYHSLKKHKNRIDAIKIKTYKLDLAKV